MTMKLRNRLLALACLLLFLTLGGLIFLTTGPRKPFAVILFVADNISPGCLTATRIYSGGGDSKLQLEEFPNTALCRNASADFSVPDTAAASTEIAAGTKVPNGRLCMEPSGTKLPSLLEEASLKGRATGLITTGGLFSPTAAAFSRKQPTHPIPGRSRSSSAPMRRSTWSSHSPGTRNFPPTRLPRRPS